MSEIFSAVLNKFDVGIMIIQKGETIFTNNNLKNLLGISIDEIAHKHLFDYATLGENKKLESFKEDLEKNILPKNAVNFEIRTPQGISKIITTSYSPLVENEEVVGYIINVKENREFEKKRAAISFENLNQLKFLDFLGEHLVLYDTELSILWCNKTAADSLNLHPDELIGCKCFELWHKRNMACEDCPVLEAKTKGKDVSREMITPDNRVWLVRGYPIHDYIGQVIGLIEITQEITDSKITKKALGETEQRYNTLFEGIADAVFVADSKSKELVDCNQQALKLTGFSKAEIRNMQAGDLHPEDVRAETMEAFAEHSKGKLMVVESEVLTKEGKRVPVSINSLKVSINNQTYLQGIFRDITHQKKTEMELIEREEKYRMLFNHANDAIFLHEITLENELGKIIEVNDIACQKYGYTREEFLNMKITDINTDKYKKLAAVRVKNIQEKKHTPFETAHIAKDGTHIPVEINARYFTSGNKPFILSVTRDITERRRAEEKIKESEEKYRGFVQNFEGIAFRSISGYKPTLFDGAVEKITGYKAEEFLEGNMEWNDVIFPDDFPISLSISHDLVTVPGFRTNIEYRIVRKDGKIRWIRQYIQNIVDENNQPVMKQGTLYDITERKEAEIALKDSEELYRTLVETSPNGIVLTNFEGDILMANKQAATIYGIEHPEKLKGINFSNIIIPEDLEMAQQNTQKAIEKGEVKSAEYKLRKKTGEIVSIETSVSLVRKSQGTPLALLSVIRDITERKKNEQKIVESEEKYRKLVETAPFGIFLVDLEGAIIFANQQTAEIIEYQNPEDLVGTTLEIYFPKIELEKIETVFKEILLEEDIKNIYLNAIRKDGIYVPIELSVALIRDSEGEPSSIMALIQDITERRKTDDLKREAYEQIEQNIESFSVLVDRIRNPLMTIIGTAELENIKCSDKIMSEAMKIDEITKIIAERWESSERFRKILRANL